MPSSSTGSRPPSSHILLLGLWIGLLAGFAEALVMLLKLYVIGEFLTLSRHAFWMAPVANAILFSLLAIVLLLIRRLLPAVVTLPRVAGSLAALGLLAVLLYFREIHLGASLLIAAGLGVQTARLLSGREERLLWVARRSATGLVVITAVLAAGLLGRDRMRGRAPSPMAAAGTPSILLIILDTVRAANMSLYGYGRLTTPFIDGWARGGMVIERAISTAPWTLPSHASMFTGKLPTDLETNWNTPLERAPVTLAAVLREKGYATAGFVANSRYAGWETGLGRGFDHYEDYPLTLSEVFRSATLPTSFHKTFARYLGLPPMRPRTDGQDVNRWFLRWLDQADSDRPFFVFLNYLDAHDPYDPSPGFQRALAPGPRAPRPPDGERVTEEKAAPEMRLYDAAIAYLDSLLGGLFHELERRGRLANTLVVLTSDHGEEFAEHEIMGHAASLYRPSVEVPLVFALPGRVPPGRMAGPVSLVDLAPTILDLSGNSDARISGSSLRETWDSTDLSRPARPILSHIRKLINQPEWWPASQGDMMALISGPYRYIWNQGDGREELYDFERDPLERNDLAKSGFGQSVLPALRQARAGFTPSPQRH